MEESDPGKQHADKSSGNWIVRVLVIVFIGIPVLVELMTLFNLINVNLWGEKPETTETTSQTTEAHQFVEGDTLFAETELPLLIDVMRIKVSTQRWQFDLGLYSLGDSLPSNSKVIVDSLKLRTGQIIQTNQVFYLSNPKAQSSQFEAIWELPSGDIPNKMFLSLEYSSADTLAAIHRQIELGNLPVRYTRTGS